MSDIRPSSVPFTPESEISQDSPMATFEGKTMSALIVADALALFATSSSCENVVIEEAAAAWHNRATRAIRIRIGAAATTTQVALATDGPAYLLTRGPWREARP